MSRGIKDLRQFPPTHQSRTVLKIYVSSYTSVTVLKNISSLLHIGLAVLKIYVPFYTSVAVLKIYVPSYTSVAVLTEDLRFLLRISHEAVPPGHG